MLGKDHNQTLTSMNEVRGALNNQGKHEVAGAMHRQTLALREKVSGEEHPSTPTGMSNLAGERSIAVGVHLVRRCA